MPVAAAIAGAAVIGAGASIISGNKAAKAQRNAAETQAAVEQQNIAEQRRQYDQTRADYAPYRETGYGALGKLASLYGVAPANDNGTGGGSVAPDLTSLYTSPGYQFRLNEGLKAVQRSAAARGSLASGGTMKALDRYAEGNAASEFDNYTSRLAQLAGIGQSATGSTAAAGATATNAIGNALTNTGNAAVSAGNARASSYANTGAAISNGAQNLASLYLYKQGGGFGSMQPPIARSFMQGYGG